MKDKSLSNTTTSFLNKDFFKNFLLIIFGIIKILLDERYMKKWLDDGRQGETGGLTYKLFWIIILSVHKLSFSF